MENKNPKEHIEKLKISIFERLKLLEGAPGVGFHDVGVQYFLIQKGPTKFEI
jgi:hypothetical protein